MAQALLVYHSGESEVAGAGNGGTEGKSMMSSEKQKTSATQWVLQLVLVLAVVMALWK